VIARLLVLLAVCSLSLAFRPPGSRRTTRSARSRRPRRAADAGAGPGDPNEDGLKDWQQLLIGAAGIVLLGGIAWAILRDAKQAAPADDRRRSLDDPVDKPKGSRTPPTRRVKQNRAKAKTARRRASATGDRRPAAGPDGRLRCPWGLGTPDYVAYHDEEWGRPVHGDDALFERISLEAFQSGSRG
jgi:hypothetical protein